MKDYVEFKEAMVKEIKGKLSDEYKEWVVNVDYVPKVNGFVEAISIAPPEGKYAVPNLYVNDFYDDYLKCGKLDDTIQKAADYYEEGMRCNEEMVERADQLRKEENVVMSLINTKTNTMLLEKCPHREFLDLSIIYRWILDLPDGSFNSAIIYNDFMNEMELDEEGLYKLAWENTQRLFPPHVEEVCSEFNLVTNESFINGAITMMYDEPLAALAEKLDSDLYILPSSIHEVIAIPTNQKDVAELRKIVREVNDEILNPKEILSDEVYFYSREDSCISIA